MAVSGGMPRSRCTGAGGNLTWTGQGGPGWPQNRPEPDGRHFPVGSGPAQHALVGPCCDPPRSRPSTPDTGSEDTETQETKRLVWCHQASGEVVTLQPGASEHGPPALARGSGSGASPQPPSGPPSRPLPDPCHNGGSCTDGVNMAFCDCLPGFQGAFCEEDINECASNPCRHGANCTDCVDSYTCTCPAGFSGIHCENNTPDCTERRVPRGATQAAGGQAGGPGAGPVHPTGILLAGSRCPSSQVVSAVSSKGVCPLGSVRTQESWRFLLKNGCAPLYPTALTL